MDNYPRQSLTDVAVVPTGTLAAKEAAVAGVPIQSSDFAKVVDVTILEPDEVSCGEGWDDDDAVVDGVVAIVGRAQARPSITLVHTRPRSRRARRSLRTSPVASLRPLRPPSLGFNPRPRRLSTPTTDAFQRPAEAGAAEPAADARGAR